MEYSQEHIEEDFKYSEDLIRLQHCSPYLPIIHATVVNALNGQHSSTTEQFIIDTGASYNILGNNFQSFFKKEQRIGNANIQYGNSSNYLPVYKIHLKIKGRTFENISVALDEKLKVKALLGNQFFLKHVEIINLNYNKKKFKLINFKFKE